MILTIVVFLLILGLLIFVHELGHFIMAKRAGAKVEEFGFGFPPRVFGKKVGETIYSLNLIPLGGFVKILGEGGEERKNPKSFANKSIFQRFKVLIAGVVMNLVLAAVLLSIGFSLGLPTIVEEGKEGIGEAKIQIVSVAPNSPAAAAGIKIGDEIRQLTINKLQFAINSVEKVQNLTKDYAGREITLGIKRGGENLEFKLAPRKVPPEGEGPMGVALAKVALISYPWYKAIWLGFITTLNLIFAFILAFAKLLKDLIFGGILTAEVSGPVGIAVLTSQMTKLGFIYVLQFTAIISINLAIINAFPFPALDGGRILFLVIEKIKGSPVSQKLERMVHTAGFIFLMGLIVLITFRDIRRLF